MSYSVWVEAEFKHGGWHQLGQIYTITDNLAEMFKALLGNTPNDWSGMRASDLAPKLDAGVVKLHADPSKYKQYEGPNETGTIFSCNYFMATVRDLCIKYPYATVREVHNE